MADTSVGHLYFDFKKVNVQAVALSHKPESSADRKGVCQMGPTVIPAFARLTIEGL